MICRDLEVAATRRSLITGLAALLVAPAIVRVSSIMPVKPWDAVGATVHITGADERLYITVTGYDIFTGEPFAIRVPAMDSVTGHEVMLKAGSRVTGVTLPGGSAIAETLMFGQGGCTPPAIP